MTKINHDIAACRADRIARGLAKSRSPNSYNPLIRLAKTGDLTGVRAVIEHGGYDGINEAFKYAAQNGHLKVAQYLILHGAYYFIGNGYPLKWAVTHAGQENSVDFIKFLVDYGIEFNKENTLARSALNGSLSIVKYLASIGVDMHCDDEQALAWAASRGHIDTVRFLIENGGNVNGLREPFLESLQSKNFELIMYFIKNGADRSQLKFYTDYEVLNKSIDSALLREKLSDELNSKPLSSKRVKI